MTDWGEHLQRAKAMLAQAEKKLLLGDIDAAYRDLAASVKAMRCTMKVIDFKRGKVP